VHTFAQSLQQNSIDGLKQNEYRSRQIEPGSLKNFTGQSRGRSSLTAVALPD
jgi:hypothetical protein